MSKIYSCHQTIKILLANSIMSKNVVGSKIFTLDDMDKYRAFIF